MSNTDFCAKCGAPLGEGHTFCRNCGQKVGLMPETQTAQQPPAPVGQPPLKEPAYTGQNPMYRPAPAAPPRKKGTMLIVLSIVFFVLAAAVVAAVFLFGPYAADPKVLSGNWEASVTAEKVFNDKTSYVKKEDLNDPKDITMTLALDKNGKGTMNLNDYVVLNAACANGQLSAAGILDDSLKITFDGTVKKEKDGIAIKGTWNYVIIKGAQRGALAQGSWEAEKE